MATVRRNDRNRSRTSKYSYTKMREQVKIRDDFTCQQCGRREDDGFAIEVDHIVPWSLGGDDTMDNLVTLCKDFCHREKSRQEEKERYARRVEGELIPEWSREWF